MRIAGARLHITRRALARYYFSGLNKSSVAGHQHVVEGTRIVRRYGPLFGRMADVYGFMYRHFDLKGCMDEPPACSSARLQGYRAAKLALKLALGSKKIERYNWHFASLQERKLEWWDYKRPRLKVALPTLNDHELDFKDWTGGTNLEHADDDLLPASIDRHNLVLNRPRLRKFLERFASDADLRDFLLLDSLSLSSQISLTSTGVVDSDRSLALRPYRTWEYVWLFKGLDLRRGDMQVLDLGGPLSHLTFMAALAGNEVLSLDTNESNVEACKQTADLLGLKNLRAELCDFRKLERLRNESFDRVTSCSLLGHLNGPDRSMAMGQMARVLTREGRIGVTFDYGERDESIQRLHPHCPPRNAREVMESLVTPDLKLVGNSAIEDPHPGTLFNSRAARYTIASLFLEKMDKHTVVTGPPSPLNATSLLGNLSAPRLPALLIGVAASANLQRQRQEAEKQSWVTHLNQLIGRIEDLEESAAPRTGVEKWLFLIHKVSRRAIGRG
jgi:2-polyprenyl-3-methyl-5-hydroxy-6-metoxy-1,4-benzoquinol methylase